MGLGMHSARFSLVLYTVHMPNFTYQSLSSNGQARSGVLTAVDRADAVRQLLGRGETATFVELHADGKSNGALGHHHGAAAELAAKKTTFGATFLSRGRPSLKRSDMAQLMRELATALEAGLPMMQSLRTVRRQAHGKAMPVILDYLIG
jgi:type II secretory pathway component PulF